ncbi:hypothetical protein RhiirA1_439473 [Rhizophagus irregularis]|uniref:DRBM domain-containing protein n=3 Tax=Rhizophagus irregularis TaxID=588596 RepID=A0A2I1F2F3_9GLOM|nr:hypothetical protein RhiirA1_439473 [Rhizophagus irregularis]PKY28559.1 hypothetical protein RhiirB3_36152 [Rhizophagus irregularis]CAB4481204.1 unnamed protein product [Rhizophagus irregularis]CAB5352118.1 unnamed protein product [Rhizophagus irregularis]
MYNNNSNQMYPSNMHASRSAVDALLKDLGAEPLFSSINDPPPGIPVSYNNYNPVQSSEQNAFSEAFISLLQRINQQNAQNLPNTQNIQNIQNLQNQQQLHNSSQIFGQSIQQQQQQQNQNLNSNQVGLPNPISILNEMHQRNRGSSIPPKYSFTIDPNTGNFYCQLEVFGKVFKTERPTLRKQQAKEEAALMALRNLVNENNSSDGNRRVLGSDIMKLYEPSFSNYPENRTEIISKSESWYRKQLNEFPGKQPRVILLEFCQMHRLSTPSYQPLNDYNGHTYYECSVGDRRFKSDKSFVKSSEAKDYVAHIAFEILFKEMCEKERRNDVGQVDTRSILNFIENHITSSPSSNINSSHSNFGSPLSNISPHSNLGSPHSNLSSPLSNLGSPLSNLSPHSNLNSPHSNLGSSHSNISSPHSLMNSSHSDVKLNVGSSHLNVTNPYSNFGYSPNPPSHLNNSSLTGLHNPQSGVTNSHLNMGSLHTAINNLHSGLSNPHSSVTNPHNPHSSAHNPYSSVTNPHNPQSSITSSHFNMNTNPHLSMGGPHSNVNNSSHLTMDSPRSNVDSSFATNITSPHSHLNSSYLNVNNPHTNNNSSHLNEITASLVLPNYSHEVSNIKIEESNPLSPQSMDIPIIKPEESNIRDQLQTASSPISYHPYRTVGRERFPQNPSYNNNQFIKKNTGFCKKFTSLLYEMSQSKRWTPPEFNFENGINGFICVCSVQDYMFRGKACSRKADAKESAAEEAYRFLARNNRG